jgi:hypothetical protein
MTEYFLLAIAWLWAVGAAMFAMLLCETLYQPPLWRRLAGAALWPVVWTLITFYVAGNLLKDALHPTPESK